MTFIGAKHFFAANRNLEFGTGILARAAHGGDGWSDGHLHFVRAILSCTRFHLNRFEAYSPHVVQDTAAKNSLWETETHKRIALINASGQA